MSHPYFDRFLSTATMMQAEQELLELGEAAVPVLDSLFSGEARNEFGVQYRKLGLPLRCAIEVASRLGVAAKPLEPYLREEASRGVDAAARALGSLGTLEAETVEVLAQSLDGEVELSYEAAWSLVRCGEANSASVIRTLEASERAAAVLAKAVASLRRRDSNAKPSA
jgi:hypothetical protein